ncbi:MAG TPA: TlpA disulfide reductase family protein [Pyrinomonadaceae bacterium]|jgi:thiol-disulfide isomerase/thioredoxin|nr:TlpA disulfide reductase family protein [Pyrinomonadaceae bacterium]
MPMNVGDMMPRFKGVTEWFNATGARAEAEAKGHPTLVHFWSVGCDVCKANMPRVAAWRDEHGARGLRVVAVHVPRTEDDRDVEIIREALSPLNITEPCAVDNERMLSKAFHNERTDVPAYYLFDGEGKLVYMAGDERGPDMIASALETLLTANEGTPQAK